jgi:hypothetical protein
LALVICGMFAACGGGSSVHEAGQDMQPVVGMLDPPMAGATLVELDQDGALLQSAVPSDASGSFTLPAQLSGSRIEALSGGSVWRLPVMRSARVRQVDAPIEVTPLTTLFDQLVGAGQSPEVARDTVSSLVEGACGSEAASSAVQALYADTPLSSPSRTWLLQALGAYLDAFGNIGVSIRTPGIRWAEQVVGKQVLLAQMCAVANQIHTDAWLASAKQTIAQRLGITSDDDRLDALATLQTAATRHVLAYMGLAIVDLQYPALANVGQQNWRGREGLLAIQWIEAQFLESMVSTRNAVAPPALAQTHVDVEVDRAGQVVRSVSARTSGPRAVVPKALRFSSEGSQDRSVRLFLGDTELADFDGILARVLATPAAASDEPLWKRAWRFVTTHRRHRAPISGGRFLHQPDLYLRSLGAGYCDDVASVLHWIWRGLGQDARVVGLGGHVVSEVNTGARWELYDADLGLYYFDRSGAVASVNDIANDPDLLLNPPQPLPRLNATSDYELELVGGIYASKEDNAVESWYSVPAADPLKPVFTIPRGGYLEIEDTATRVVPTINAGFSVDLVPIRLWYPPGYSGTVDLPLILVDLAGDGRAHLLGDSFELTPAGMASTVLAYYQSSPDTGIARVEIEQVGPGGLTITMVANPMLLRGDSPLSAKVIGPELSGISVTEGLQ